MKKNKCMFVAQCYYFILLSLLHLVVNLNIIVVVVARKLASNEHELCKRAESKMTGCTQCAKCHIETSHLVLTFPVTICLTVIISLLFLRDQLH